MKRSNLKRKVVARKPRAKPMRRTPAKPTDNPAHLRKVRAMPCAAIGLPGHGCKGRIVAHHATYARRGSKRAYDAFAIPLASVCHTQLHALSGPFRGWDKDRRRQWEEDRVAETLRKVPIEELRWAF